MPTWITVRTGIAFFLVLFGWHLYASAGGWFMSPDLGRDFGSDLRSMIGAVLLAIGLTLLWRLWLTMRSNK